MTHRTTLVLSTEQLDALRRIADRLGYLADRGPTKGSGSVSALVQAIADGDAVVMTKEHHDHVAAVYRYHESGDIRSFGGW